MYHVDAQPTILSQFYQVICSSSCLLNNDPALAGKISLKTMFSSCVGPGIIVSESLIACNLCNCGAQVLSLHACRALGWPIGIGWEEQVAAAA